jgi:hypothetical protein
VPEKLRVWQAKRAVVEQLEIPMGNTEEDVGSIRNWLMLRMDSDEAYFRQRQRELDNLALAEDKADPLDLVRLVLDRVRRAAIHPHRLQEPYRNLFEALKEWRAATTKLRTGNMIAATD